MRYSIFPVLRQALPRALYMAPILALGLAIGDSLVSPAQARTATSELTEADTAELIVRSLGLLGVEYRFGGSTPAGGLDCSGFVRHVYQEALGLKLPRTTEEMSSVGVAVDRTRLMPGDLVFFNTLQRPFSHVGLYLGDDRFVHAPSTGNVIRIEPLSARYWAQRFEGGRRVSANGASNAQDRAGLDQLILARSSPAFITRVNLQLPAEINGFISNH
jgi:cell wall-associated NlpC family hydrolase